MIVSSRSALVFSTMCTSRGRSRNAEPAAELLDRLPDVQSARPFGHPDDLVVQVVVPRCLSGRDEAREQRRARRAVRGVEEDLERAGAGRLLRVRTSSSEAVRARVDPSARAGRRPEPTVMTTSSRSSSAPIVASSPAGTSAALRGASALVSVRARSSPAPADDVEERVRVSIAHGHGASGSDRHVARGRAPSRRPARPRGSRVSPQPSTPESGTLST